jgi:uncharacterized protein (TIGR02996 family)
MDSEVGHISASALRFAWSSASPPSCAMGADLAGGTGREASAAEVRAGMAAQLGPEEERLLAAICDAPDDDDQPRLVYGDWLLDRAIPEAS